MADLYVYGLYSTPLSKGAIPFGRSDTYDFVLNIDVAKLFWDVDADSFNVVGDIFIGGSNKELRFYEGVNYVGFEAPALSANQIWVLPSADGNANEALGTDGSGALLWRTHDELAGFVANEHIDHSGVSITAGVGLSGGGDITVTRTLNVDINGTADLVAPAVNDELLISDTSDANTVKKADLASVVNLADHDALTNFVANKHIDWTSATDNLITTGQGTFGKIRANDKIFFTQADENEYIDSLNDGYMDYGATTAHRFNANIEIADAKNIVLDTTTGTKFGTATTQKLAFYNSTPVVQPVALTTQLTTITHTAPGTPDYALQDMVDVSLGAGWAFADHDEANTVLSVIANLQTRVDELETKLQSLGLLA